MNEKNLNNLRAGIVALCSVAAVFALIGAIGILAVSGNATSISTSSLDGLEQIFNVLVFHDFARIGAVSIFALSAVGLIVELLSQNRKLKVAVLSALTSVFGFVGLILISFKSLIDAVISAQQNYYSSRGESDPSAGIKAMIVVGTVFIMISAVGALASLVMVLIGRFMPNGFQKPYNYGYPNQQYPQQGIPVQPVQPMAQPVQPMQQPVQPMAQPVQPMAQPVQPMQQPVQLMKQSVQPVQQPVYSAPAPMPAPDLSSWTCSCGMVNEPEAKFCAGCGKPKQ